MNRWDGSTTRPGEGLRGAVRPRPEGDRGGRAAADAARAAGRGKGEDDRARRRHRGQPRPLSRRGRGAGPGRARPAHGEAAAGEAGRVRAERDVVEAPAERLPFEDDSFDTAVFDPRPLHRPRPGRRARRGGARAASPAGRLLFVEHVRAEDPGLARWQDRLEKPWRFLGDGCHCNRDTLATIAASRFELGAGRARPAAEGAADRPAAGPRQRRPPGRRLLVI